MDRCWMIILLSAMVMETHGSLLEFRTMINKMTGKNAGISYAFYGCHCGYGGFGPIKDYTDRCCHVHDCCYDVITSFRCQPLAKPYHFYFWNGIVTCDSFRNDECAQQVCECDREASLCFKQNLNTYSSMYTWYMKPIRCLGPTPPCSHDV
ncbi:basic phospholipase A2-like [Pelodytes ibericus]